LNQQSPGLRIILDGDTQSAQQRRDFYQRSGSGLREAIPAAHDDRSIIIFDAGGDVDDVRIYRRHDASPNDACGTVRTHGCAVDDDR